MPKIVFNPQFESAYKKFAKRSQIRVKAIDRALQLFARNSSHPSLHMEKLSGSEIWTLRIDKGNRMFFVWGERKETAIFFFVGPHDSYRTKV